MILASRVCRQPLEFVDTHYLLLIPFLFWCCNVGTIYVNRYYSVHQGINLPPQKHHPLSFCQASPPPPHPSNLETVQAHSFYAIPPIYCFFIPPLKIRFFSVPPIILKFFTLNPISSFKSN